MNYKKYENYGGKIKMTSKKTETIKRTYVIGWKCEQQPRFDDVLIIKRNGVTMLETPANIVYNCFMHIYYLPSNPVPVEGKMEYLLNDRPIPNWVKPQFIDRITIKRKGEE